MAEDEQSAAQLERTWREIAHEIIHTTDAIRMMALCEELSLALEDFQKALHKTA